MRTEIIENKWKIWSKTKGNRLDDTVRNEAINKGKMLNDTQRK